MKIALFAIACGVLIAACGDKVDEMKKSIDAMEQLAEKGKEMENAASEAEQVYKERVAKGDTIAIPYKDLQGYLPTSISGYKPAGEPSGSQQSMSGWSFSNAELKFVSESGNGAEIDVKIADCGGTEGAYGLVSLPFALSFSSEDDQQRTESLKPDLAQTSGMAKFDKANKNSEVLLGTRYRYLITLESRGAGEDQTKMLTDLGMEIAKKFDGK